MVSEMSQEQKDKYYIFLSYMKVLKIDLTKVNRLVTTRGWVKIGRKVVGYRSETEGISYNR